MLIIGTGSTGIHALMCVMLKKIDTTPLTTHRVPLSRIAEAYELFNSVIKITMYNDENV